MIKNPRPDEEKTIKDRRNFFRLKKMTKAIKDRIPRGVKNLFEHEEEDENYYQPLRVNSFWNNNYIEYIMHCNACSNAFKK